MKCSLLFVLVSMMTACGIGVAHGKDCQGVNFPEQAQIDGSTLTLNGLGLRQATFLKVNVYVAALYVTNVSSDPHALLGSNTPKELILHFLHKASDDDLKKAWEQGLRTTPRSSSRRCTSARRGSKAGWRICRAASTILHPQAGACRWR